MLIIQGLLKAFGRWMMELEFRKHINTKYVGKFIICTNNVPDIPIHPLLKTYFPEGDPLPFKWSEHMDASKNKKLVVSDIAR